MTTMKNKNNTRPALPLWLLTLSLLLSGFHLNAAVTVTPASGGAAISADTAATGGTGAWTTLGAITIAEGANSDFAAGTNVTLVLKTPAGFQFNTGVTPSVSFTAGRNLTSATLEVTDDSMLTITYTVSGTGASDTLVIGGTTAIQVRPTVGTPLATGRRIYRPTTGGGTGTIVGITASADGSTGTSFGALTEVAGAATQLAFGVQPTNTIATATITPAVTVRILDQFGNLTASTASVVMAIDANPGGGVLSGTRTNAAVAGTATFSNLSINKAGTGYTLLATGGSLAAATSTPFNIIPGAATRLAIITPPQTLTAGASSSPITVEIQDAAGNPVNAPTNRTISLTKNSATAVFRDTGDTTTITSVVIGAGTSSADYLFRDTVAGARTITNSFTGLTSAIQTQTVVADAAAQVRVETRADGGGTVVPAQNVTAGNSVTNFAIARDLYGNFIANVAADDWSLPTKTGGVQDGDLTVAGDGRSAVFKAALIGTATVRATSGSLAVVDSGTLTAQAGPPSRLVITTAPHTTTAGVSSGILTVQVQDVGGNPTNATARTLTLTSSAPTGTFRNAADTTAITSISLPATLNSTNFLYRDTAAGTPTVTVTGSGSPSVTAATQVQTVTAAAPALIRVETAAHGGGTVVPAQNLVAGNALTVFAVVRDAFSNYVANAAADAWSLVNVTNGVVSTDLVPAGDSKSATFTGQLLGNARIRATAAGLTSTDSGLLTVVGGPATQLAFTTQPAGAVAGAAFTTQPVVRTLDTFGNFTTNGLPPNAFVTVSLTGGAGPLQGTTAVNLGNSAGKGVATYTGLRIDVAGADKQLTVTSTNGLTSAVSAVFAVSPGAASRLAMDTQPSATAAAGVPFAQQPVVRITDAFNNLRSSDTLTVTAARGAGAGTLLGATNVVAVGGIATFTNLAHPLATNITLQFTSGALTATNSTAIAVGAGAFTRLQILLPGETAAPGTPSGKTGTPTAQTAGTAFNVTVNAVDAHWNRVTNVTDTVAISSSDANATLPANAALVAGTRTFSVTFKTAGTATVTATDVTDGSKTADTSPATTVNAGALARVQLLVPGESPAPGTATGKTGTPTPQVAGAPFTVTVRGVDANWNLQTAASGTSHTITIDTSDPNDTEPGNADLSSGIRTFSITFKTAGTQTVTATHQTSGITADTSAPVPVGAGAFTRLQLLVPGETAAPGTATGKTGTPTAQNTDTPFNVTVNAVDANWNLVNTVGDTVAITATDTNATLPASAPLSGGTGTFSVKFATAGSRTVTATDTSDGTKTPNTSPAITVNAGAFVKMQLLMPGETAVPGTATGKTGSPTAQTAGTGYSVVVNAVDANWNLVSSTHTVGLASSDPFATLPANTALAAGTRTLSVTNRTAGTHTFTVSNITDGTKTPNTGAPTLVRPGALTRLQLLVPGETALPGSATGKSGSPTAQAVDAPFTVTVNSVDANWNLVSTNHNIRITSSDPGAILPANNTLVAGSQTFNLTFKNAGSRTVTASNLTQTAITASTSPAIPVNKADQTVTFGPLADKNYGDAPFAVSATASSGLPVTFSIASGPATVAGNVVTLTGAGSVTVRASQAGNTNYNAAPPVDQTFNIAPALLTVTANDTNRAYGAPNPAFTASYSGFVYGETPGVLSGAPAFATTAGSNSPLGVYPLTISAGTLASANYTFAFVDGQLTVGPAPLTPVITADHKAYDGTTDATLASRSLLGVVFDEDVTLTGGTASFDNKNVGNGKTVTATGLSLAGADVANYTLVATTATTTADITPLAVSGSVTVTNKVYDGTTNATIVSRSLSGSLGGDTVTLENGTASFDDKLVGTNKNVTITGLTLGGSDGGNYALVPATLTATADITARPLNLTVTGGGKTYDGTTNTSVTLGDDRVAGDDLSLAYAAAWFADPLAGAGKPVTVTGLSLTGADAANYLFALTETNLTADIAPAPLTVTANDATRAVGEANPVFTVTYSGFVNGENPGVLSGAPVLSTTAGTNSPAGSYPITVTVGTLAAANYTFNFVNGTLTVLGDLLFADDFTRPENPGDLAPWVVQAGNWTLAADALVGGPNAPVSYGFIHLPANWGNYSVQGQLQFPADGFGGGLSGRLNPATGARYAAWVYPEATAGGPAIKLLKFSDWGTYGYNGVSEAAMAEAGLPAVGTEARLLKLVFEDDRIRVYYDGNEVLDVTDTEAATLASGGIGVDMGTITTGWAFIVDDILVESIRQPQTITFDPLADRTYGDAPFALEATASSGLPVSFSVLSGPALITDGTNVTLTGVGSVTIRASQAGNENFSPAPNVDQSFNVAPAALTVTADAKAKTYGTADPALTYAITSGALVGDDELTGALTRNAGETIGAYAITQGTLAASTNYNLSFVGANLTITPAALTVTADAKAKAYGAADPALTYAITSGALVGSDAFTGALTRVPGEAVGLYAIQQGTLTAGTNYNLSFIGANLEITAAPVTPEVVGIVRNGDGSVTVTFSGTPDAQYLVQATATLGATAAWSNVSTNTVGPGGTWTYTDTTARSQPQRYFRAAKP